MTTGVNTGEMVKQLKQVLKNQKEVSIIGHDNIDVDSFLSGILLEKLLKFMGINARFMILEPIKYDDTYSVLKKIGINNMHDYSYPYEEDESRILFLVDHYETSHKGKVIGCIDHHPTIKDNDYEFSYVRNATSAGFMVYELMKEAKYPFNFKDIEFVITSMMIDTVSFRSSKAIDVEIEEAKKLVSQYCIDYMYLEKVCLCLTEIDKMSIEGITTNGLKEYLFNGYRVKSAYVQLYRTPEKNEVEKWIDHIHKTEFSYDLEMYVFLVFDLKFNYTDEYQIMRGHTKHVKHKGILSRGKDIMPLVEKRFTNTLDQEEMIQRIIEKMSKANQTIATMESCTGGSLAGAITDVSGASDILRKSYVVYCNDAKIEEGVPASTINTFTVYSKETAIDMAKAVKAKANSNIGVGITGQLGRVDPRNVGVENNKAWYSIATNNKTINAEITLYSASKKRSWKKKVIITEIINDLYML